MIFSYLIMTMQKYDYYLKTRPQTQEKTLSLQHF